MRPVSMAEPAVFLKPNFKRSLYAAADRVLASRSLRSSRAATWFAACRNPIKILLLEGTVLSGEPFFAVFNEGLHIFRSKRYRYPAPRRGHRTDQRNARSFHRVNSLAVYRHALPRLLRRSMPRNRNARLASRSRSRDRLQHVAPPEGPLSGVKLSWVDCG